MVRTYGAKYYAVENVESSNFLLGLFLIAIERERFLMVFCKKSGAIVCLSAAVVLYFTS